MPLVGFSFETSRNSPFMYRLKEEARKQVSRGGGRKEEGVA